jgi:predicted transcriptional regulator
MTETVMHQDSNQQNDYNYSRETYYELIEKGKDALDNMIDVARESEHPRAYEVLAGLLKNVSDVNDKLMELNKKQKALEQQNATKQVENQQNNFYIGSSADIQRLLQGDIVDATATERTDISGEHKSQTG